MIEGRGKATFPLTGPQKVCLCMMVRNESRVIRRALDSIASEIDGWSITDTGSTDGTQDIIREYFEARGIPGVLHQSTFVDFGASRTETIENAQALALANDMSYLILLDGDEVYEIRDPDWKRSLDGSPYLILYDDALSYRALYLVPAAVGWQFIGRTHEYLEATEPAPAKRQFDSIVLHDHGDGGSKSDKFTRDVRLLELTLSENEADERAWFYLAESLLNGNIDVERALRAYTRRSTMGGFEEESWYAAYRRGHCIERLGNASVDPWPAIVAYLQAWERRPWRAEPLTEIVRLSAERGLFLLGTAIGEYALQHVIQRSERKADILFVSRPMHGYQLLDWLSLCAYRAGYPGRALALASMALAAGPGEADASRIRRNMKYFELPGQPPLPSVTELVDGASRAREEGLNVSSMILVDAADQVLSGEGSESTWELELNRSISAWYVKDRRDEAIESTNRLVATRDVPDKARYIAMGNRFFTVAPLSPDIFHSCPLSFEQGAIPDGYVAMNPSVALIGGRLMIVIRAINYFIRDDGSYQYDGFVDTRNLIGILSRDGRVERLREIATPEEFARRKARIRGFEGCRIITVTANGAETVLLLANHADAADSDRRAMFALTVEDASGDDPRISATRQLHGRSDHLHQKNWMPVSQEGSLRLVYSCDPTVILAPDLATGYCRTVSEAVPPFWCGDVRGGSQLAPVIDASGTKLFIAIVHGVLREHPRRSYYHAFTLFDLDLRLIAMSSPFVLRERQVEFAAGCVVCGDELMITWGENDARAWMGRIAVADALKLCQYDPSGRSPGFTTPRSPISSM